MLLLVAKKACGLWMTSALSSAASVFGVWRRMWCPSSDQPLPPQMGQCPRSYCSPIPACLTLVEVYRHPENHCLSYILHRSRLPLLPAPRDDKNVLTSEEKMIRDRHRTYVEYLVTGGQGISCASPSDRVAIDSLCEQFEGVHGTSNESPRC